MLLHDFNADNFDHSDLDFIGGASITAGGGENPPVVSALSLPALDQAQFGSAGDSDGNGTSGTRKRPPVAGELGSLAGQGSEWGRA